MMMTMITLVIGQVVNQSGITILQIQSLNMLDIVKRTLILLALVKITMPNQVQIGLMGTLQYVHNFEISPFGIN